MRRIENKEDRVIAKMKTLLRYIDQEQCYRLNGKLRPKVRRQLDNIIESCMDIKESVSDERT